MRRVPHVPGVPLRSVRSFLLFLLLAAAPRGVPAQGPPPAPPPEPADFTLEAAERAAVIDRLVQRLNAGYVFPEKAAEMERSIRARAARGEYDAVTSGRAFATLLTEHLQAVSRDKHLRVRLRAAGAPAAPSPEERRRMARERNFGVGKAEILPGNIGYLEVTSFGLDGEGAEEAVAEAMTRLADADALIVDVRRNGGGSPRMVQLVSSYLFGEEPVHLNSLYFRPADRTDDFWTNPKVKGRKFGAARPVYVLTSARTFSAAEEFTYNLQARGRATIVGETTGGGAHPGGVLPLGERFSVFVPSGRAINPVTRTNWEGVGVRPEIAVPAERALEAALEAVRGGAPKTD